MVSCEKQEQVSKEHDDLESIFHNVKKDFALSSKNINSRCIALSHSGLNPNQIKIILTEEFNVLYKTEEGLKTKVSSSDLSKTFLHYVSELEEESDIEKSFIDVTSNPSLSYNEKYILVSALAVLDELQSTTYTTNYLKTKVDEEPDKLDEAIKRCNRAFYRTCAKTVALTAVALAAAPVSMGATISIAIAYTIELVDAYLEHRECLEQAAKDYEKK